MPKIVIFLFIMFLSAPVMAQENESLACAKAGYIVCQLELGKAYALGYEGVTIDYDQALFWLKQKPIEQGNIQAIDLVYAIEQFRKNGDKTLLDGINSENLGIISNAADIQDTPISRNEEKRILKEFRETEKFTPEFMDLVMQNSDPILDKSDQSSNDLSSNEVIALSIIDNQFSFLSIYMIFSFILTWLIGLTPPFLIRKVFYKKPLNLWPAISLCVGLFILNIVTFKALGSDSKTHSALILVAFFSYYILRGKDKVKLPTKPVNEKGDN